MTKIFVMAGTEDGRKLAEFLSCKGYEVTASVTSDYGRKILEQYEFGVNDKKLDAAELAEFLREGKFNVIGNSQTYVKSGFMITPRGYENKITPRGYENK